MRPLHTRTTCAIGRSCVWPDARERVTRRQVMTTVSPSVKKRVSLTWSRSNARRHLPRPLLIPGMAVELAAPGQVGRLVQHYFRVERGGHVGETCARVSPARVHVSRLGSVEPLDHVAWRRLPPRSALTERNLVAVRITPIRGHAAAAERGGGAERVLHELHEDDLTVPDLCQNGERRRDGFAQRSGAVGESAEHGHVLAFAEQLTDLDRFRCSRNDSPAYRCPTPPPGRCACLPRA